MISRGFTSQTTSCPYTFYRELSVSSAPPTRISLSSFRNLTSLSATNGSMSIWTKAPSFGKLASSSSPPFPPSKTSPPPVFQSPPPSTATITTAVSPLSFLVRWVLVKTESLRSKFKIFNYSVFFSYSVFKVLCFCCGLNGGSGDKSDHRV